jgi:hypothetical protein
MEWKGRHKVRSPRCKWRIEDESDPSKSPKAEYIEARLRRTLEKRLSYERILTNKKTFGKKSLDIDLVRDWERIVYVPE